MADATEASSEFKVACLHERRRVQPEGATQSRAHGAMGKMNEWRRVVDVHAKEGLFGCVRRTCAITIMLTIMI
jgi:hypothetical protein